jgi:hypothetical protein
MTLFTLIVWVYLLHALRRYQYVYYLDHFVKINAQFTTMILFSILSLQYDIVIVFNPIVEEEYFGRGLDDKYRYMRLLLPELFACFLYVITKIPEDCFNCFNRQHRVAYSAF